MGGFISDFELIRTEVGTRRRRELHGRAGRRDEAMAWRWTWYARRLCRSVVDFVADDAVPRRRPFYFAMRRRDSRGSFLF